MASAMRQHGKSSRSKTSRNRSGGGNEINATTGGDHQLNVMGRIFEQFNPTEHGLESNFTLMNFLQSKSQNQNQSDTGVLSIFENMSIPPPLFTSLVRHHSLTLVQSGGPVAMLPFIDDPSLFARIVASWSASYLHAMGAVEIDSLQATLTIQPPPIALSPQPTQPVEPSALSPEATQQIITGLVEKGINSFASECDIRSVCLNVVKSSPTINLSIICSSVIHSRDLIYPNNAQPEDVLVLTKPLGTLPALEAHSWLGTDKWQLLAKTSTEEDVRKGYARALDLMTRSARAVARTMSKFNIHAAHPVGVNGILGSAKELAACQSLPVDLLIFTLPVICGITKTVGKECPTTLAVSKGTVPEISGGLLISLPQSDAAAFNKDLQAETGIPGYIIGSVVNGSRQSVIMPTARLLDVPLKDQAGQLW